LSRRKAKVDPKNYGFHSKREIKFFEDLFNNFKDLFKFNIKLKTEKNKRKKYQEK
jgi:hypothetical protein